MRNIAVVATPTSPILRHTLHTLSHESGLKITVLTRQTPVDLVSSDSHSHDDLNGTNGHHHTSSVTHSHTDFSKSDLKTRLQDTEVIVCIFQGSDIHLQPSLISIASTLPSFKLFIPSEFGLDTSNAKIRELLPPYQTRFMIQNELRKRGLRWKAIYSGVCLEEGMKSDGVFCIDVLWASVVWFQGYENVRLAVSGYEDIAAQISDLVVNGSEEDGNEVFKAEFRPSLDDVVKVVEDELEKTMDRYEGDLQGARKEAKERMKLGFFDGGVSLMARVAVWDGKVQAWGNWKEDGKSAEGWEHKLRGTVRAVRDGEIEGKGCGC